MKKLLEQIVKFGIVGVICFGIDFSNSVFSDLESSSSQVRRFSSR